MRSPLLLILFVVMNLDVYSQEKVFNFNSFKVEITNSQLNEYNKDKQVVYTKYFRSPHDFALDLDGDGTYEYLVSDSYTDSGKTFYVLYVFNTFDSLSLADSIMSGLVEPYEINSTETGGPIIVSGNPNFDSLNIDSEDVFLPINCWSYKNGKLSLINNLLYKIFEKQNEDIIDYIDNYYLTNKSDCKSASKIKAAIAAGYVNYIHSGDKILARQFIRQYYHCDDSAAFQQLLDNLLKAKSN